MKRYYKKIGDLYMYTFNGKIRYMQYIAVDELQIWGDVVRVFEGVFNDQLNIDDIISLPVDFYCITYVSNCVKFGNWLKIGKSDACGDLSKVKFRCANDYGKTINGEPIKTSNNWYGWTLGDAAYTQIGPLHGEWITSDIGDLLPPQFVNERLEHGEYKFIYPSPE